MSNHNQIYALQGAGAAVLGIMFVGASSSGSGFGGGNIAGGALEDATSMEVCRSRSYQCLWVV